VFYYFVARKYFDDVIISCPGDPALGVEFAQSDSEHTTKKKSVMTVAFKKVKEFLNDV
jgi:hypothetical protein